jgi:pSer/pThr/pTyr-binding forkhead associated (FHA) protein
MQEPLPGRKVNAWVVRRSGPQAGGRYLLTKPVTSVGRDPANDVVIDGEESKIVSSHHLEIRNEEGSYHLYDLGSLNGTFVDGRRVTDAPLDRIATIELGSSGPRLEFELETLPGSVVDTTMPIPASVAPNKGVPADPAPAAIQASPPVSKEHDELLSDAVQRAREARHLGVANQTAVIMRQMLDTAIHRSSRRFKRIIMVLVLAVIGISGYAAWSIQRLKHEKSDIDLRIRDIEGLLSRGGDAGELEGLIDRLQEYEKRAVELQRNLLYRLGVRSFEQDFVEQEIKTLMAEFGAEEYSIPPEFIVQVNRFIRQYQERDRDHMTRLLGRARKDLEVVRSVLRSENLPPDLAYMILVESAFISGDESAAGAAGLWQFTAPTARAYGMKVDDQVDERLDIRKSTRAASRYIRDLILEFGAGSSVMLALAAYNVGPSKVKRVVRDVKDPIKQRNFWYLYRIRALPAETREYVPKIIAGIIIGRNPEHFGF